MKTARDWKIIPPAMGLHTFPSFYSETVGPLEQCLRTGVMVVQCGEREELWDKWAHRKPVKVVEQWGDGVELSKAENKSRSCNLDQLQRSNLWPQYDKGLNTHLSDPWVFLSQTATTNAQLSRISLYGKPLQFLFAGPNYALTRTRFDGSYSSTPEDTWHV